MRTTALIALLIAGCSSETGGTGSGGGGPASGGNGSGTPGPSSGTGDVLDEARQTCVDTINMCRATIGVPAYERWVDAEACTDGEAAQDGASGIAHGAFGQCGEFAQDECPGWPGPAGGEMIQGCLAQMWAEGPGSDFST